jgi:hypothetical protein
MVCIVLRGFSIDPLYLVYNSVEQEAPVLHIFKFHGPSGTQRELIFLWHGYFPGETTWEEEAHEWGYESQTSTGGAGPRPGRTTHARLHLVPVFPSVLISDWRAWSKTPL